MVSCNFSGVADNPTKQSLLLCSTVDFFSHGYQSGCFSKQASVSVSAL